MKNKISTNKRCLIQGLLLWIFPCWVFAQMTVGLFVNESDAYPGYTLFSNNEHTYLIDNCGLIVNEWTGGHNSSAAVYLTEEGHLLKTVKVEGDFNAGGLGGRFERYDWDGNIIWQYEIADAHLHAHHDIQPLPNGNFLATLWENISETEAQQKGRIYAGDVWSEKIVEIKPLSNNQAEIVWEWRLFDHLIQDQNTSLSNYGTVSEHPEKIDLNFIGTSQATSGNWVHLNAIDYLADLDQIVVSSRLFSEIWVIDHSTSSQEAQGSRGDLLYRYGNPQTYDQGTEADRIFYHQHDVRYVETGSFAGQFMVFNNDYSSDQSSIEIWTPTKNEMGEYAFINVEPDLTFTQTEFYSEFMAGAHFLPNDNILICEGRSGRIFETDLTGHIVWEYLNPVNTNGGAAIQGGTPRFNALFRATKYPANYPAFANRNLEPSEPIELSPEESDCYTPPPFFSDLSFEIDLKQNISTGQVEFTSLAVNQPISLHVFNVNGQVVKEQTVVFGTNALDLSVFADGLYILFFENAKGFQESFRLIKYD